MRAVCLLVFLSLLLLLLLCYLFFFFTRTVSTAMTPSSLLQLEIWRHIPESGAACLLCSHGLILNLALGCNSKRLAATAVSDTVNPNRDLA